MSHFTETDHVCTEDDCPRGTYYITAIDGLSWWRMAGPYDTHQEALADVKRAYELCDKHDRSGRGCFMGWGTARVKDGCRKRGILNERGLMSQDLLAGVM